jgi:hypothetical protein
MPLGHCPAHARRGAAWRGHGQHAHRGELTADRTTAETRSFLGGNGHQMMAYTWLHENLEGEAGKVRLTIEAVSVVEEDDVDGEIGMEVEEGALRLTP